MKVLHMISGGDKGGAKTSVFALLLALNEEVDITVACFTEGVFYREVLELPVKSVLFKQKFRNDLSIIGKLSRYVRQNGFDIIHAHGARANFISMMLKPFVFVPIVTTVHSDYKLDFTDKFYKRLFYTGLNSVALRTLDYYIGVSEEFRRMLINRGFDESRVFSVYNSLDFKKEISFCPKDEFLQRYGINAEGKILVGIIGRFDFVKGHDIFLRCAARVKRAVNAGDTCGFQHVPSKPERVKRATEAGDTCGLQHIPSKPDAASEAGDTSHEPHIPSKPDAASKKEFLFLLAGEGPEEATLRKLAESLGIAENVVFCGFVNDIFSFINAIDINVCASRSESFPFMLLEGSRLKKPTVSTAVGGIPELISSGETGFLVPDGDYAGLAEKILFYAENPETAALHGENLHLRAKTNFSKESLQKKSVEIYEEILRKEKAANRLFDVMLTGYYGYANSGDDAILDTIIKSLRNERDGLSLLVLSKNPQETTRDYGVFAIHRLNFFRVRRYMKRSRLIVYGGGSLMQDITSTRSLVYYTFLVHLAKHAGMRVMLYGNGIGPIIKPRNEKKVRRALNKCDYISLRDPESLEFIKKIGVKNPNVAVSIDPVFNIAEAEAEPLFAGDTSEELLHSLEAENCFAVSLRPWQYNEPGFIEKIAHAINHAAENYNLTPLLIPMHLMDVPILKETAKRLHCRHEILTKVYDYKTIIAIIARTRFAICMRLHALIYAAGAGVPIIGLVYDPKVAGFISYMNEETAVDTANLDLPALLAMIDRIMQDPAAAKEKIARERERLKKLAGRDAKVAVGLLTV
ncbi:MAG: polysaccharide pyruvyl transferase CsaB [Defluviitaleaceae bacterium]|nr:polysaccharide pyruvyl transferase CsaB [Defluviitaleaceae bacterium]